MIRSRFGIPALAVLAVLVGGGPAFAAEARSASVVARPDSAGDLRPTPDSVVVTGNGEVFGRPDVVTASFGVEAEAATVAEALKQATAAATRMRDTLAKAGLTTDDLQTSNAGISSKTDKNGKVIGYTANQGLTATIRNLPKAGEMMTAAIKAGGDAARLSGVTFSIENKTKLIAGARKKAFADAREAAALYAQEAGRKLGQVIKVTETSFGGGALRGWSNDMAAADAPMPIEPGRLPLTATVTVEWALVS
ncbi:SIMPL domain-containing protein [Actinoplanes bogorensis]|uniref:SIMPL domain-containing protein n=1 Tax=Paractinoplanes bogorensis TaxID=1610840 RepID=A0ABS5YGM0_9ACTN|nr:SIMPL domain-containing protein [Actinoplanes bogorensis]MBU2662491.1 SIMPL domain-containing protein [Actinoplanes bogorensis]